MSYSNPNTTITYKQIDVGAQLNFGINFYYLEGEPVIVAEKWDYSDPTNPTKLSFVQGVDYTIDESNYPNTEVIIASPLSVDEWLILYRSTLPIQTSTFSNGPFPAESVDETFDRNMMVSQEQDAQLTTNITNIENNTTNIEVNAGAIVTNQVDIATNASDIATNAGNIATNSGNIATNTGNIATNTGGIATNVSAIADHETRIDDLEGQISSITAPQIHSIAAAEVYNADTADTVIIDTNDTVQVNLPAATSGYFVRVKVSEKINDITVVAATNIDGFGTTYTISSEYESISLVSDGTKWYIL